MTRVNLLVDNPNDVRSGYVNIDPYAQGEDSRISADLSDLSHTIDDGEAIEIVAHEILDYYPGFFGGDLVKNWVKKLAHGGTLTVSTVDIREVSRQIASGILTLEEANDLLYGKQEKDWDAKKAGYTLSRLTQTLEALGLQIMHKRVANYRAVVTGKRP